MIGIIDYGSGNFTSVCNAVDSIGKEYSPIDTPEAFDKASHIILPGVGALQRLHQCIKSRDSFLNPFKIFFEMTINFF